MDQADVFVLLDDVQFERHSWQHRNRVKGARGEVILSVPVRRTGLDTTLLEATISDVKVLTRHLTTIIQSYARAPGLTAAREDLDRLFAPADDRLLSLSLPLIAWLAHRLGIETPVLRSSELDTWGRRDELVRSVCDAVGATTYLATAGSAEYMAQGHAFDDGAVTVLYHRYEPAPYPQLHGDFVPRLAAIDAVLNLGPEARAAMIAGRSS